MTSGIRIGTPAVTTRGMGVSESICIADYIADVLDHPHDESVIKRVGDQVGDLCAQFPIYSEPLV